MKNDWFYHEHNIDTKISNNYKDLKDELIRFKDAYYSRFKDIPEINKLGLDFYNKKIFAGLKINTV